MPDNNGSNIDFGNVINLKDGPIPPDVLVRMLMKEHGMDFHNYSDMRAFFKLTKDLAEGLMGEKFEYTEEDIKDVFDILNEPKKVDE